MILIIRRAALSHRRREADQHFAEICVFIHCFTTDQHNQFYPFYISLSWLTHKGSGCLRADMGHLIQAGQNSFLILKVSVVDEA